MTGDINYLLSFLKGLDDLGSAPPMTLADLVDRVSEVGGDTSLIEALFLSDDLIQHQSFLSGEITELEPSVLTEAQLKNEDPLPDVFTPSAKDGEPQSPVDALWSSYYRHAAQVAQQRGSDFLKSWISFEVGLRNALAAARAKSLGIDPHPYMVVAELGDAMGEFDAVIAEWTSASDPLAGLRVLDQARWRWITENDGWFSFTDDELAAYAAKLILLNRWKRLGAEASRKV